MRDFKFYKENSGRWFVELPEWEGSKDDLEMVCGADLMLDILAQGDCCVDVVLSTEKNNSHNHKFELSFLREESEGAWYKLTGEFHEFELWLCYVTKFVFGNLPVKIYIY
jgi:hypothetical protein